MKIPTVVTIELQYHTLLPGVWYQVECTQPTTLYAIKPIYPCLVAPGYLPMEALVVAAEAREVRFCRPELSNISCTLHKELHDYYRGKGCSWNIGPPLTFIQANDLEDIMRRFPVLNYVTGWPRLEFVKGLVEDIERYCSTRPYESKRMGRPYD